MKSVITCDTEGIIETFNAGAEKMFEYEKEEVVGSKRVSLFSPGEIVLQNVGTWLSKAAEKGEYVGETIFIRKSGEEFPARIRITPTYKHGKDQGMTGYCGVTEELDEPVNVPIKWSTYLIKALAITRMPFLSAVIAPAFVGGAFAYHYGLAPAAFSTSLFVITVIGLALLHLASNLFNDYFDVKDGTDAANDSYFTQFTGGSRAIELRLIDLKGTWRLAMTLFIAAAAIGIYLTFMTSWITLAIGLVGAAIGYFYTAPPLRLVARKGLGELSIALAFGCLVTLGTHYVLAQELSMLAFMVGLPAGLLTANILLINEFPDAASDATTGKNHLVVTYGKKKSMMIYLSILVMAVVSYLGLYLALGDQNIFILAVAAYTAIHGAFIFRNIRRDYDSRALVQSNIQTIILSAASTFLFALSLVLGGLWM
jgi:1,4-dihydroxy-2-naphthoate octaprenyltransferase